ncbi:MAG: helix-turn-helix domain-containing protein [Bacilli bacterium]
MNSAGRKIRLLRLKLLLSQSDLAGSDMTRAFISQVETGRILPSLRTLSIIANRLGRPLSYFLDDTDHMTVGTTELQNSLQSYELGKYCDATQSAKRAISALVSSDDPDLLFQARIALAKSTIAERAYEQAWEHLYDALEFAVLTNNCSGVGTSFYWLGCCAYLSEEFPLAKRHFAQAMQRLAVRKDDLCLYLLSKLYYGSSILRLGDLSAALESYQYVYRKTGTSEFARMHIDTGLGLGWVHHLLDNSKKGYDVLLAIRKISQTNQQYRLVNINHNLGVISSCLGQDAKAIRILQDCNTQYSERGDLLSAASVLEEISAHHLRFGRLAEARRYAEEGLNTVTDHQYANLQRGRLHRLLAKIAMADGLHDEALRHVEIAIVYFQAVHSHLELEDTLKLHHDLRTSNPTHEDEG